MRPLTVYNFITLNGFYKGPGEDTSWNRQGAEEYEYAAESAGNAGVLVFGRVTYEHMAAFWPTPAALNTMPEVAAGMNRAEKIVFSKTLKEATWSNTRLINGDMITAMKQLKATPGPGFTILGSGSIVTQFADAGLIDEYEFMLNPVALGEGASIFQGLKQKLDLELVSSRTFKSGVLQLRYKPLKK